MSPDIACPLCGGPTGHRYRVREMMLGTRELFDYGECLDCRTLVLVDPPADLGRYYPDDYYAFSAPGPRPFPHRIAKRLRAWSALRGHERIAAALGGGSAPHWAPWFQIAGLGPGSAVCDLGCGNGELLLDLASAGVSPAIGADPLIPEPVARAGVEIERTTAVGLAAKPQHVGRFDLVMFNHSFEHLSDPLDDLAAARELLTPDGTLMLRVPLAGCWAWRHYGTDWVALDAPRHLFVPTLEGITAAATSLGLEVREVLYDSTELQFWRSEQYRADVALFEPESHQLHPSGSPFSSADLDTWRERARELNRIRDGDTAAVFLARRPPRPARPPVTAGERPQRDGDSAPLRVAVSSPDPRTPGGITAVVSAWRAAGLGAPGTPVELISVPTSAMDSPFPTKVLQMARATARLLSLMARKRVDVVHLNTSTGGSLIRKLVLARCCRVARVPYIAHMHSGSFETWLQERGRNRRLARSLFGSAAVAVVLADRWAGVARLLGARRVEVIPNGIPASELAELRLIAAERKPGPKDPVTLLFYGRWSPVKGLDVLARALADLRPGLLGHCELRVFGNGDRAWAEAALEPLGSRAELIGWLDAAKKREELAASDILVAPSRQEGLPTALVEARAAGLTVLASAVGAVPEVLGGDPAATLVPPGDPEELRAALEPLVQRRLDGAAHAGESQVTGFDELPDWFAAETAIAQLEDIYREAASRRR